MASPDEAILTVAIPTFNRNEVLKRNLRLLLPQLTPRCRLLILDNHSDIPVADTLADLWPEYPAIQYEVIRHRVNIGGSANVVRCFELCETEWIWVLGDDDEPQEGAIDRIITDVQKYPESVCLNYRTWLGPRSGSLRLDGIEAFVRDIDYIRNSIFISANVYQAMLLREFCRYGFHYSYSCAPHLVMLLQAMSRGGICVCLAEKIVDYVQPSDPAQWWSLVPFTLGLSVVPEVSMSNSLRRVLARKLQGAVSLRYIATAILHDGVQRGDPSGARFLFAVAGSRYLRVGGRLSERIAYPFLRMSMWMPRFSIWVERFCRRIVGAQPFPERSASDHRW